MKRRKKVVFDLCGTLYNSNTTLDFVIFYHLRRKNTFKYLYCKLLCSYFFKVLAYLFEIEIRDFVIKTLKGEEIYNLEVVADAFVSSFLIYKKNMKVHDHLARMKGSYEVIVASASIDIIVMRVAKSIGVNYVSSQLGYEGPNNSLCSGIIRRDIAGKKSNLLRSSFDYVFTDNLSDIDLIKNSKFSYVITKRKNKKKWLFLLSSTGIKENQYAILFV